MTTAFILALIAAGGVTVVLIAAINYVRRLERENARLMRIIGEQNREIAELHDELVKMGRWEYARVKPDEVFQNVEIIHETDEATGQIIEKRRFKPIQKPAREDELFKDEPFEKINASAICIDPRKKNSSVKIPSRWEEQR